MFKSELELLWTDCWNLRKVLSGFNHWWENIGQRVCNKEQRVGVFQFCDLLLERKEKGGTRDERRQMIARCSVSEEGPGEAGSRSSDADMHGLGQ